MAPGISDLIHAYTPLWMPPRLGMERSISGAGWIKKYLHSAELKRDNFVFVILMWTIAPVEGRVITGTER